MQAQHHNMLAAGKLAQAWLTWYGKITANFCEETELFRLLLDLLKLTGSYLISYLFSWSTVGRLQTE